MMRVFREGVSFPLAVGRRVEPPRSLFTSGTEATTTRDDYVVGNRRVFFEMNKQARKGGISPIEVDPTTLCQLKIPVVTAQMNERWGVFLVRSATIMIEPKESPMTLSWIVIIPKKNEESDITKEEMSGGIVVDVNITRGSAAGFGAIQVFADEELGHIVYHKKGTANRWVEITATPIQSGSVRKPSLETRFERDSKLMRSALDYHSYIRNREGFADSQMLMNTDVSAEAAASEQSVAQIFEVLRPLYSTLKAIHEELGQDHRLRSYYRRKDPVLMRRFEIFIDEMRQKISASDPGREAQLIAGVRTAYSAAAKAFQWDGAAMSVKKFRNSLALETDPERRRVLLASYSQAILAGFRAPGGLFESIPELNRLARSEGHGDFIDKKMREHFKRSAAEMREEFRIYLDETDEANRRFIADLKQATGVETVSESDVDYLVEQAILKEAGLKELPTLSQREVTARVLRCHNDMGYGEDLGRVYYDLATRKGKYGNDCYVPLDHRAGVFIFKNYPPRLRIREIVDFFHENDHQAHFGIAGLNFGNDRSLMYYSPKDVKEGVAEAWAQAFAGNERALRKYFPSLPPKYVRAFVKWNRRHGVYTTRRNYGVALTELNLYQENDVDGRPRTIEERVAFWPNWVRCHLHVVPLEPQQGGYAFTLPHFVYPNDIGGFAAYPRGTAVFLASKAFHRLIAATVSGKQQRIDAARRPIDCLFREGGLVRDSQHAVSLLRSRHA